MVITACFNIIFFSEKELESSRPMFPRYYQRGQALTVLNPVSGERYFFYSSDNGTSYCFQLGKLYIPSLILFCFFFIYLLLFSLFIYFFFWTESHLRREKKYKKSVFFYNIIAFSILYQTIIKNLNATNVHFKMDFRKKKFCFFFDYRRYKNNTKI